MLKQFHDMGLHYYLLMAALCFGSSLAYAQAQVMFALLPGDRIRVIVDNSPNPRYMLQGRFISFQRDTLFLGEEDEPLVLRVPNVQIVDLLRRVRTKPQVGKGAALGFLAGGLLGILVIGPVFHGSSEDVSTRDAGLTGVGVGGISGMVIGIIVGATREAWMPVPLQAIRTQKQN